MPLEAQAFESSASVKKDTIVLSSYPGRPTELQSLQPKPCHQD